MSIDMTTVWASVTMPGFHHWPGATGNRAYLANSHRHLFHARAAVAVDHRDRDVEFHDLGDLMRDCIGPAGRDWGTASCEDISLELWHYLRAAGLEPVEVTVSEDGEFGATITGRPAE